MKIFQRVVCIVFIFILGFSTSCKKNNNKSGVTFKNVSKISDEIVGEAYYCEVPNAQKSISFTEYIEVERKFSWSVSLDIEGIKIISSKVANLEEGLNYFYVQVKNEKKGNVDLYNFIVRRKISCTVDFNTYIDFEIDSIVVEENTIIKQPEDLEKIGFTFGGWDYDFSQPIIEDTIIDAIWIPDEYKAILDPNGGTLDCNEVAVYYYQPFELPIPEKEGYTFNGWYYENQKVTANLWLNLMDLTFVAKWTPVNYSISYENLKDAKNENPVEYNIDTNTFVLTNPVHYLYTFAGWTYEGQTEPQLNVEITKGSMGDMTFTANWLDIQLLLNANDEYEVVSIVTNNVESIVIPSEYNGKKVTSICAGAFKGSFIKNITLTSNLKTIADEAFSGCSELTEIIIPNGVEKIGQQAFYDCLGLTTISLPNSVTSIGYRAFYNCKKLKNITLPNALTTLDQEAFMYCELLENIVIPDTVTNIGFGAFSNCNGISTITLPFIGKTLNDEEITWIGYIFGAGNYKKNEEYLPAMLEKVVITKNNLIGDAAFYGCSQLTEIIIPNRVEIFGDYAFYGCENLKELNVPSSVRKIGAYAIANCTALKEVIISKNIIDMAESAFSDCENLKISCRVSKKPDGWDNNWYRNIKEVIWNYVDVNETFVITFDSNGGSNVKDIKFNYGNKNIDLPTPTRKGYNFVGWFENEVLIESITEFDNYNLTACWELITYTISYENLNFAVNDNPTEYNVETKNFILKNLINEGYVFLGWTYDGQSEPVKDLEITMGTIGDKVFTANWEIKYSEGLEYTIYSDEYYMVTGIGNCTDEHIKIAPTYNGKEVKAIGECAFENCINVLSITVPDSVTYIGFKAFYNCNDLVSLTLPFIGAGLDNYNTYFGYIFGAYFSFANADYIPTSLKEVIITGETYIDDGAFRQCSSLNKVVILNAKSIGERAFYECTSLTYLEISGNVESLGESAFWKCTSLSTVILPDTLASIGENAFWECTSLSTVILPDTLTSIGESAFSGCSNLTNVEIPNSITSIGYRAFYNCNNLQCNIFDNAQYLGNENNPYLVLIKYVDKSKTECIINENTKIINSNAFDCYHNLSSVTIPDSVVYIGDYAFSQCGDLKEIIIPDNVTYIGRYAFWSCSGLKNITLSKNIVSIEESTFCGCSGLTSIIIPDGVTSICYNAFEACTQLESITIPESVTEIKFAAFRNCRNLETIIIPIGVVKIEKDAFYECNKLTIYCKVNEQPSGWEENWYTNVLEIIWGYK